MKLIEFGKTIKMIRTSKKMTQETLAGGINSRSALSKFEKGQKTVYLDTFLAYLYKLDISFDEFIFIHNNYINSNEDQLYTELLQHFAVNQTTIPDELKRKIDLYSNTQNENPYINIFAQYYNQIIASDKDKQNFFFKKRQLAEKLWLVVRELDQWYIREIKLLILIIAYLPTTKVNYITNQLLHRLKDYQSHPLYNNLFITFNLNLSLKLIRNGDLEEAKKVIEKAQKVIPYTRRADYEAINKIRYGVSSFNKDQIYEGLVILTQLGNECLLSGVTIEIIHSYPEYYFQNRQDLLKDDTELILERLEDDYLMFI
ncbi:helix-turn-helix domain-containing protein [Aerococcus urinaeequi]|uniref:helix-turn-helix domain-containing protein n=1 Tax=Aerococcus urinaeequi TaxID=51665 RepID=UPI003D6A1BAD